MPGFLAGTPFPRARGSGIVAKYPSETTRVLAIIRWLAFAPPSTMRISVGCSKDTPDAAIVVAAASTPGSARSDASVASMRRCSAFMSAVSPQSPEMRNVRTRSGSKPGATRPRASKLRSRSPAPNSSGTAKATWRPTSSHCNRCVAGATLRLRAARSLVGRFAVRTAGSRPNSSVAPTAQHSEYATSVSRAAARILAAVPAPVRRTSAALPRRRRGRRAIP